MLWVSDLLPWGTVTERVLPVPEPLGDMTQTKDSTGVDEPEKRGSRLPLEMSLEWNPQSNINTIFFKSAPSAMQHSNEEMLFPKKIKQKKPPKIKKPSYRFLFSCSVQMVLTLWSCKALCRCRAPPLERPIPGLVINRESIDSMALCKAELWNWGIYSVFCFTALSVQTMDSVLMCMVNPHLGKIPLSKDWVNAKWGPHDMAHRDSRANWAWVIFWFVES